MSGISNLFNIGTSSLFAFQESLSVTAHNIANVNTKGYSKQDVILSETLPLNGRPGQIGTGVEVKTIKRNVDLFVNSQILSSKQQLGKNGASQNALSNIESLFDDSKNQSLGTGLNDFFNAIQDVSTDPSNVTARSVLLSKAQTLTAQRQSLDQEVDQSITTINSLAKQIADLNDKISQAELSGQNANDLRDQRQQVVNSLGEQINVATVEDGTGQLSVFVGSGQSLVEKNRVHTLSGVANSSNSGLLDVDYNGGGTPVSISSVISGGRLKGLLDARDTTIPATLTKLDALASNLVSEINTQHKLGYGLDGSTGLNFFTSSGVTAKSILVSLTDGKKVAASDSAAGVPGNNVNALALGNLQHKSITALGSVTLNTYYQTTVSDVGSAAQQASQDLEAQQNLQDQLDAQWSQISGVSLDEELVHMLTFQRAFEASSKVVVMADELMQTILTLKR